MDVSLMEWCKMVQIIFKKSISIPKNSFPILE